jgi:hypothetical protein
MHTPDCAAFREKVVRPTYYVGSIILSDILLSKRHKQFHFMPIAESEMRDLVMTICNVAALLIAYRYHGQAHVSVIAMTRYVLCLLLILLR